MDRVEGADVEGGRRQCACEENAPSQDLARIPASVKGAPMKSISRRSPASNASSAARGRGKAHGTTSLLLSIDPGLNGTGYAYWEGKIPVAAGVVRPLTDDSLLYRANDLYGKLRYMRPEAWAISDLNDVVIEFPEYHESFKGRTARATGSMDKLCFAIGVLAKSFSTPFTDVHLPHVREWKGQLPKDVVMSRMLKHYGKKTCDRLGIRTHAWDALGIGHWFLNREK